MRYRGSNEQKHYMLKGILVVLVGFLIYVAFASPKPTVTQVEKIVPNAVNQ